MIDAKDLVTEISRTFTSLFVNGHDFSTKIIVECQNLATANVAARTLLASGFATHHVSEKISARDITPWTRMRIATIVISHDILNEVDQRMITALRFVHLKVNGEFKDPMESTKKYSRVELYDIIVNKAVILLNKMRGIHDMRKIVVKCTAEDDVPHVSTRFKKYGILMKIYLDENTDDLVRDFEKQWKTDEVFDVIICTRKSGAVIKSDNCPGIYGEFLTEFLQN